MKHRTMNMACAAIILAVALVLSGCEYVATSDGNTGAAAGDIVTVNSIPAYSGSPYIEVNGNVPYFTEDELTDISFETYSELDALGRCGVAFACVGVDLMPTEERGSISQIRPSGWQTVQYDSVDGNYLYNRCHLIGFQLSGENANERNLITGTRYLNVEGMLPFENMVADYVKETEQHVLYRVTPIFDGSNLVARGVLMEAMSVEDSGESVLFNVYAYNVQPGITIDYATGESRQDGDVSESASADIGAAVDTSTTADGGTTTYILNTSSMKFHTTDCSDAEKIADKNRQEYTGSRDELIEQGYSPCGRCKP